MLHSRRRPRSIIPRAPKQPLEDPYSPTSANYEERHQVRVTQLPDLPGLIRVDYGAPPTSN